MSANPASVPIISKPLHGFLDAGVSGGVLNRAEVRFKASNRTFRLINCRKLAQSPGAFLEIHEFPALPVPEYCAISWVKGESRVKKQNTQATPAPSSQHQAASPEPPLQDLYLTISDSEEPFTRPEFKYINMTLLADAASFAARRKIDWLWIDVLCIKENVHEDVRWHLKCRPQIFIDAALCIVLPAGLEEYAPVEEWSPHIEREGTPLELLHAQPGKVFLLYSCEKDFRHGEWEEFMLEDSNTLPWYPYPITSISHSQEWKAVTKIQKQYFQQRDRVFAISSIIPLLRGTLEGARLRWLGISFTQDNMWIGAVSEDSKLEIQAVAKDYTPRKAPSPKTEPEKSEKQTSQSAPPYNWSLATLLIAMLHPPAIKSSLPLNTHLVIAGMRELAVLINCAHNPTLTTSPNLPYVLSSALTRPQSSVRPHEDEEPQYYLEGRDHISLLKELLRRYSPTGNFIFWLLVLFLTEYNWTRRASTAGCCMVDENKLIQGILEDIPHHDTAVLYQLVEDGPLTRLKLEEDHGAAVLHIENALAHKVQMRRNQTPAEYQATDRTCWEELSTSNSDEYWICPIHGQPKFTFAGRVDGDIRTKQCLQGDT
ncbi:hypothetical protein VTO73DRAFT_15295 [Trametes versicolor]